MTKKLTLTMNGTGAAVYLCLGFEPDWVKITNNNATYQAVVEWNKQMLPLQYEGILEVTGSTYIARTPLTIGAGVTIYKGGDLMTAANQTNVTYGGGIYLVADRTDYNQDLSNGVQATITKWTLDTSANRTGHFDNLLQVSGRTGVGSKVYVRAWGGTRLINPIQEAIITALNSIGVNDTTADDVTLSAALPTGDVVGISGRFGTKPAPIGSVTPPGIKISASTTSVNPSNAGILVEAGLDDA